MKCPKCHYLSFDPEPRCRNCGFSLGLEATDLPIASEDNADGPMADLELRTITPPAASEAASSIASIDAPVDAISLADLKEMPAVPAPRPVRRIPVPKLDRPRHRLEPDVREAAGTTTAQPPAAASKVFLPATSELPLFVKTIADPAPGTNFFETPPPVVESVANVAATPAAPSVMFSEPAKEVVAEPEPSPIPIVAPAAVVSTALRAAEVTPETGGAARRKLGPLDRDLLNGVERIEKHEKKKARESRAQANRLPDAAGAGRRLAAATLDGVVLSGILAGLLALTLRWISVDWSDVAVLPIWPTAAFLTLVAAGYLLLFTAAAGQTPGKMLVGIRVVGAGSTGEGSEPLSPGQACLRELLAVPAVLMLGLGFFPALVGAERGVHDRIAATRVVRG